MKDNHAQATLSWYLNAGRFSVNATTNLMHKQYEHSPRFLQLIFDQQWKALGLLYGAIVFLAKHKKTKNTYESTRQIAQYGREALTALPHLLAYCVTDKNAPPIFSTSLRLMGDDFLPVFLATYLFYLTQHYYYTNKEKIPESLQFLLESSSLFFSSTLFIFSLLRKIQFNVRSAVLLIEFPKAFYVMQNTTKIDNSVCTPCNRLRFTKGEIRAVLLYVTRLYVLEFVRKTPWIGEPLAYFFRVMFTGQIIAEYHYASAGVCERHRLVNYQEYFELFFMFGLLHQASINVFTVAVSQSTLAVSILFEKMIGNVFLATPLLTVLANMPPSIYESIFSGISMFYLVGLAYYMPFPTPVEKTQRWFPDFGSRWFIETLMDFFIFSKKKELKQWVDSSNADIKSKNFNAADEIKKRIDNRKEFFRQMFIVRWFQFTQSVLTSLNENAVFQRISTKKYIKIPLHYFLPSVLRSKNAVLTDRVLILYTPKILTDLKNAIISVKSFLPVVLKMIKLGKKIDAVFSNRAVRWTLSGLSFFVPGVGFLLPTAGEILTADFIMNKAPLYIDDLLGVCLFLNEKNIINEVEYDVYKKQLCEYKKNIDMLRKLLNELPKAVIDDLLVWMRTPEFNQLLTRAICYLDSKIDMLVKIDRRRLNELGFDSVDRVQLESFEYDQMDDREVKALLEELGMKERAAEEPDYCDRSVQAFVPKKLDGWDEVDSSECLLKDVLPQSRALTAVNLCRKATCVAGTISAGIFGKNTGNGGRLPMKKVDSCEWDDAHPVVSAEAH